MQESGGSGRRRLARRKSEKLIANMIKVNSRKPEAPISKPQLESARTLLESAGIHSRIADELLEMISGTPDQRRVYAATKNAMQKLMQKKVSPH